MAKPTLIVVGNGMVGHKLIELLIQKRAAQQYRILVFGEEARMAYDRVHLSSYFEGKTADDLALSNRDYYEDNGIELFTNERITEIDSKLRIVRSESQEISYDTLILATGSFPFVPPIRGREAKGVFVYRTIDDLDAMAAYAKHCKIGAVIGGGLLGLEAANALKNLGLETHVVEVAPYLMPRQVDELGGEILRGEIERLGIHVHTGKSTSELFCEAGAVRGMNFADGESLEAEMVVFSAGIRPRDELGRAAGLRLGERGGIIIDDFCKTSDTAIFAIGECALYKNQIFGLVAPGYEMARVVAEQVLGNGKPKPFTGAELSTKLKLLGIDVASFGQITADNIHSKEICLLDSHTGSYKKIIVSADGKRLLGAILVGDAESFDMLLQVKQNNMALPPHPEDLVLPAREASTSSNSFGLDALPDSAKICTCENVSKGDICSAINENGFTTVGEIKDCTRAGTGCGSCVNNLKKLLNQQMEKRGIAVVNHLCEHFPYSRQELYHLIRVQRISSFSDVLARFGKGLGCEICKPAVASILASTWNDYILEGEKATLQDTNDYYLANIQRDGTYSVIPRIAGGEITPDKLIALGQVAKDFNLYLKITGGQRIDMLGAHLDQLPLIWERLIEAGFESGHAYGKALRTVKSCVGSTWCRYGQQDSVSLAIMVENRYKGLRAPHKLKSACSGCARECAEAQSKDFGMIATERGYNLYLGGNGGMRPRHAQLFAEDLNEEEVIKYLDRYLMFYIRTADKLQRTADWLESLEGGIEYLRQVIIEDSLGIADELERDMAHIVGSYDCEWKRTLEDSERMKRFRYFVDSNDRDANVVFVEQRGQKRPAFPEERAALEKLS
jgi:nitrite reductase (NADH) large subunit